MASGHNYAIFAHVEILATDQIQGILVPYNSYSYACYLLRHQSRALLLRLTHHTTSINLLGPSHMHHAV